MHKPVAFNAAVCYDEGIMKGGIPMLIRLANAHDAEALVHLNAAFNGVGEVSAEDICRSLETSGEVVVVAVEEEMPVGFCCAQVHHSFCYPAPVAEVTEMYVDADFRRQGAAQGMLAFLEKHLREKHGVDEIHLLTGRTNHVAQAVYRKAGFIGKDEVYMVRELG